MSLSESVCKFIEKEKLFRADDILLCAVSGGLDSMTMLDILRNLGYKLQVAHVNYMLRGQESIGDQDLVMNYCRDHQLPFHLKKLTTEESEDLATSNLQEKARIIRYHYFHQLMTQIPATCICTAHHTDDVAETFLLHTLRGSGLSGLSSIRPKMQSICRPMLQTTKKELVSYADEHKIPFRTDSSNLSDKYDRNFIRNRIFSELALKWDQPTIRIADSARFAHDDYKLLKSFVDSIKTQWIKEENDQLIFGPLSLFKQQNEHTTLAFHLLREFDFNNSTIHQMISDPHISGKIFKSVSHQALIDRNRIIIKRDHSLVDFRKTISKLGRFEAVQGLLIITKTLKKEASAKNIQFINANAVNWPLTLRTWKRGDKIAPLGMHGKQKKVSDILSDQKVDQFQKMKQLVLANSNDEIIWVVDRKLSDSFKYDSDTTNFLKLEWQNIN